MQNKGIVICVAVLLTLASIFYLSFSFTTQPVMATLSLLSLIFAASLS
jgi:hypothetical protein